MSRGLLKRLSKDQRRETARKETLLGGERSFDESGRVLRDDEVRKRYAFIVNSARESMAAIGLDRRYEAVNDALCRLHGLSRATMQRLKAPEPWPSEVQSRVAAAIESVVQTGEPSEVSFWADMGEGVRFLVASWTPYVRDDAVSLVVESVRDETERAHLDAHRAQAVQHLSLLSRASQRALDVEAPSAAAAVIAEELVRNLGVQYARVWSTGPGAVEVWAEEGAPRANVELRQVSDAGSLREPSRLGTAGDVLLVPATLGRARFVVEVHGESAEPAIVRQVLSTLGPVMLRAEQKAELLRSRDDYRALFETAQDAILIIDPTDERILEANKAAGDLYGYLPEELVGLSLLDMSVEPRRGRRRVQQLHSTYEGLRFETRQRTRAGDVLLLDVQATMVQYQGRTAILSVNRDLTGERRQQRQLRESERRFRDLMENVQAVAVLLDERGRITYANPFLAQLVGSDPDSLEGVEYFENFIPEDQRAAVRGNFELSLESGHLSAQFENDVLAAGGRRHTVLWSNTALHDASGQVIGAASFGVDITSRKRAEAELRHLAEHDPLTECANRSLLAEHLRTASALLFIDIDRFKTVNDSLGHPTGDRVLLQIANRLRGAAPDGALVARVGGDEFAISLDATTTADHAHLLARSLRAELGRPYVVEGRTIHLDTSLGVALRGPTDGGMDLLRDADIALSEAKRSASAIALCEETMRARAAERLDLETLLRRDIGTDALRVVYQPVVLLETGATVGFEALARWSPEGRGPVSPFRFITLAEESGLIEALGVQVLEAACHGIARLRKESRLALPVAVNASARQLMSGRFIAEVERCLDAAGLPPSALKVEVTESQVLEDSPEVRSTLASLRAAGIQICLDDFGTGYSSLRYLSRHPCDIVKVDRSFVVEASESGNDGILRAVVALSDALGAQTVAEGVETVEQAALVRELGCTFGQGYLWARPLSLDDAVAHLTEG